LDLKCIAFDDNKARMVNFLFSYILDRGLIKQN